MSKANFSPEILSPVNIPWQSEFVKTEKSIESVLNTPLNVENINTYAEDALKSLIAITDQKVSDYRKTISTDGLTDKEIEDAAFKHYKIEDINSILDNISHKAEEIRGLNSVINSVAKVNEVIIEPDNNSTIISYGNGEFKERRIIDRLKTVLFVLKEDFDVDVSDEEQFGMQKGIVRKNMMRRTSYFLLDAKTIDRTILICDEEGNSSYVFDSNVLVQKGINQNSLINSTKSELNNLIEETPTLGRRIVYSKDGFIPRIIDSINSPINSIKDEISPKLTESVSYLYPKAPEGYLSVVKFAKELGISPHIITNASESIKELLGQINLFKFPKGPGGLAYSPKQQEIIFSKLEKEGKLEKVNLAPEGYLSINRMAKKFDLVYATVADAVEIIEDQLGEIYRYKFSTGPTALGFSPEQQQIILKQLEKRGMLIEKAPEGYLSASAFAKKYNIHSRTISEGIEAVKDKIGNVNKYKVKNVTAQVYSPEQQIIIEQYLKSNGKFNEIAPDGYLSATAFAKENSLNLKLLFRTIDTIRDQLGETHKYTIGSKVSLAYSPQQQQIILNQLKKEGKLERIDSAPEGYLPIVKIGKKYHVSPISVVKAIDAVWEQIGKVNNYFFNNKVTHGYSPEQVEIILNKLREEGKLNSTIPEGYLSAKAFAEKYGIDRHNIPEFVEVVKSQLGEMELFKSSSGNYVAYSPEQQQIILNQLKKEGRLSEPAPDGYLPFTTLTDEFHTSAEALSSVIEIVKDQLGVVSKFRFGNQRSFAYSPKQQQIIKEWLIKEGKIFEKAPEGYLSIRGIANKYEINDRLKIAEVIETIENDLGEIKKYLAPKKGPGVVMYSPDQQQLIKDYFDKHLKR